METQAEPSVKFNRINRILLVYAKLSLSLIFLLALTEGCARYRTGMPILRLFSSNSTASAEQEFFLDHRYFDYELRPNTTFGTFKTNSVGYHGDELIPKDKDTLRVFCFGASTTMGIGETPWEEKYPYVLKKLLEEKYPGKKIQVFSPAIADYKLFQSFMHFSAKVIDLEPDIITIYHAANDMGYNTRFWEQWPYYSQYLGKSSTKLVAKQMAGKIGILRLMYDFYLNNIVFKNEILTSGTGQPSPADVEAQVRHDLRDAKGPEIFEEYLRDFVILAKARGVRVCLATFGSVTHDDMSDKERSGMRFLYGNWSVEGFRENLARYNDKIRAVAAEQEVPLALVDETVPHDYEHYVDAIHFSPKGYRAVAESFAKAIENAEWPVFK